MDSLSGDLSASQELATSDEPTTLAPFEPILAVEPDLAVVTYRDILSRSALADRRPVGDLRKLQQLLDRASLIVTARHPADGRLIGLTRLMCDGITICFVADLAVDRDMQGRGIGAALIHRAHAEVGEHLRLLLVSPPRGNSYYARMGMTPVTNAWALGPKSGPDA